MGESSILVLGGALQRWVHGLAGTFLKSPELKARISPWKKLHLLYGFFFVCKVVALVSRGLKTELCPLKQGPSIAADPCHPMCHSLAVVTVVLPSPARVGVMEYGWVIMCSGVVSYGYNSAPLIRVKSIRTVVPTVTEVEYGSDRGDYEYMRIANAKIMIILYIIVAEKTTGGPMGVIIGALDHHPNVETMRINVNLLRTATTCSAAPHPLKGFLQTTEAQ
uniref:Uncharacterized protein n=1 Tax=Oryza brachyantha TaxID=4533 RepID=J3LPG2_ORYBR